MKKVAVLQSSYIPWKGYFELINDVDEFIIYDDVQFSKNDWRNRNIILTKEGKQWLTIPVRHKSLNQNINEIEISNYNWNKKHWNAIITNYAKSTYFLEVSKVLKPMYEKVHSKMISEINLTFLNFFCELLNMNTKIRCSTDYNYNTKYKKQDRLISLLMAAKATDYLSGPSAKNYIDSKIFNNHNINLHWKKYGPYLKYKQLHYNEKFINKVSIIDVLFNTGVQNAHKYILSNIES